MVLFFKGEKVGRCPFPHGSSLFESLGTGGDSMVSADHARHGC